MTNRLFQKGDRVVYGTSGIYQIEEIGPIDFGAPDQPYYTLRPLSDKGSLTFVPCNNETLTARLRYLMTREEIETVLKEHLSTPMTWDSDRKTRLVTFRDILTEGRPPELLSLIRCLLLQKKTLEHSGRRLSLSDSETLQIALHSIHSEFSLSLGIPPGGVPDYILSQLGADAVI